MEEFRILSEGDTPFINTSPKSTHFQKFEKGCIFYLRISDAVTP